MIAHLTGCIKIALCKFIAAIKIQHGDDVQHSPDETVIQSLDDIFCASQGCPCIMPVCSALAQSSKDIATNAILCNSKSYQVLEQGVPATRVSAWSKQAPGQYSVLALQAMHRLSNGTTQGRPIGPCRIAYSARYLLARFGWYLHLLAKPSGCALLG